MICGSLFHSKMMVYMLNNITGLNSFEIPLQENLTYFHRVTYGVDRI